MSASLLHHYFEHWTANQPDAIFTVDSRQHISTYADAGKAVRNLVQALRTAGIGAGGRIGVLARNRAEYLHLYLAASTIGATIVTVDPRLSCEQQRLNLADAAVDILFCETEFTAVIGTFTDDSRSAPVVVVFDAAPSTEHAANVSGYGSFIAAGRPNGGATLPPAEQDLYQFYTSGTTGEPKGVVVSHRAAMAHQHQLSQIFKGRPRERWLAVAPFCHTSGATAVAFQCIVSGGSIYIHAGFDPQAVIQAFETDSIAVAVLVPAMIRACLKLLAEQDRARFPALRLIAYGAAAIAESTLREAIAKFPCEFVQVYGITEMQAVSCLTAADHLRAMQSAPQLCASAGRALSNTDVQIIDLDGTVLPPGETGEIIARGPQMMRGYWRRPDATAEVIRNGWYHTGDVGILDAEGYIYIRDRLRDVIIHSGRNVYPSMVESILLQHPAVAEAAVIGVPDRESGEAVMAFVVLQGGVNLDEAELLGFCGNHLADFQTPSALEIVETLPRTPLGKVRKQRLRQPYWAKENRHIGES